MKKVIVLLTWNRLKNLNNTLRRLRDQTDNDFDVHISNANLDPDAMAKIERTAALFSDQGMRIRITHDGNDHSCFRRFFVARDYANNGYDIVFFLDDDISIPRYYISKMIKQFKPGHYHSCYAWRFRNDPVDYWKDRVKVFNNSDVIHYGGAGISMTDAKIFQDKRLFNVIDKLAYQIDDLWMSYYCNHIAKIDIIFTNVSGVHIGGSEPGSLYQTLRADGDKKSQFLRKLTSSGWKL